MNLICNLFWDLKQTRVVLLVHQLAYSSGYMMGKMKFMCHRYLVHTGTNRVK